MERITYRKTLDVHKNGIQFMLQGFETADNLSRVIEISLMASGDAIDFPLERVVAMMYVTTPGATEPSINECTIKDNKIVYDVLPIAEEGITTMQIKIIETSPGGAKSVIASPKFAVEVTKSDAVDDGAELKTTFTGIENFIAKADAAYESRLERIELTSDCIFKAYYFDGSTYETDILQKLFLNGNVELSKSYAVGGTGVRAGEDTDNSKYYSNVSKSEALNAKNIMENSMEILDEVRLHGVYTAFSVDFNTGEVEYVSPSFKFKVNSETGELDAEGQSNSFDSEIYRVVEDWLAKNGVVLKDLQKISTQHSTDIEINRENIETLFNRVTPIDKGGTGATTAEEARKNLGLSNWELLGTIVLSGNTPESVVANIPCDDEILKDFNHFRYVIKKDSYIYAKIDHDSYLYSSDTYLKLFGESDASFGLRISNSEKTLTLDENLIIEKDFLFTQKLYVNDDYISEGEKSYERVKSLNLYHSSGTGATVNSLEYSITIELYGRR